MKKRHAWIVFFCLGLSGLLLGCTGRSYLIVDYQLPAVPHDLAGQSVYIQIKDLRTDDQILSPTAAAEFEGFRDRYNLALVNNQGGRIEAGQFDLKGLFKEAFRKRLEEHGVNVIEDKEAYVPVFEVTLKKLKIDLWARKWVANVNYEASLSRDNQLIAREMVSGEAERLRIIGRKGADTVLSELFSDMINRLNVVTLFQQAKLTS
jgi:hypothetical protein